MGSFAMALILHLDLILYSNFMGNNNLINGDRKHIKQRNMVFQEFKHLIAIVCIYSDCLFLSIGTLREFHRHPCQCGGYSKTSSEDFEPRRPEHQFNQLLDIVCDGRALVQTYGEDGRVRLDEALSKIQYILDQSDEVSRHLQILPPTMAEGSRLDIPIIPPYNSKIQIMEEGSPKQTQASMVKSYQASMVQTSQAGVIKKLQVSMVERMKGRCVT